jgi:hypothetical protein
MPFSVTKQEDMQTRRKEEAMNKTSKKRGKNIERINKYTIIKVFYLRTDAQEFFFKGNIKNYIKMLRHVSV